MKDKQIIAKLKELVEHYESIMPKVECPESKAEQIYYLKRNEIKAELSALESEEASSEISYEVLENAANNDYSTTNYLSYQHAFKNGAKWYRETLKARMK